MAVYSLISLQLYAKPCIGAFWGKLERLDTGEENGRFKSRTFPFVDVHPAA